mgnify:CR=1 FL=1
MASNRTFWILFFVLWAAVVACCLVAGCCTAAAVAGTEFVHRVQAARTAEREDQYRERVFQMFEQIVQKRCGDGDDNER